MNLKSYPFISEIYNKKLEINQYVIINLVSKQHISYYNINKLYEDDITPFFTLIINWWKSNTQIPLSLFYKDKLNDFNYILEYLENRDYEIISGYQGINLKNLSEKRIKRKIITIE